tara:strand:- start:90 stop:299 length:210 start_codon:yes stop_codon:yes gene_type:complete
MTFDDFYEYRLFQLNLLTGLEDTSEEAKQIKLDMGYSVDADYWDINHDIQKIQDVLEWYEEWKQLSKNT